MRKNDMARAPQPVFVRMLHMLNAIRCMAPFDTLNGDESLLLDGLIVEWHSRDNIMVSELMDDPRYGKPVTVYRRIMALKNKGLVCLRVDSADRRVKFVDPTDTARDYMASINKCVRHLELSPQS